MEIKVNTNLNTRGLKAVGILWGVILSIGMVFLLGGAAAGFIFVLSLLVVCICAMFTLATYELCKDS